VACFADFSLNSVVWRFANREGKRGLKESSETNENSVAWSQKALIDLEAGRTILTF
jgi:hypothetical protein